MDDNFLYSIFKINPNNKLNRVEEGRVFFEREWVKGFSNTILFRRSVAMPAGKLSYTYFSENVLYNVPTIQTTEVSLITHLGIKENFINGDYNRVSLGSKYPIFDLMYTKSLKGFKSDYSYQKFVLAIKQRIGLRNLGFMKLRGETGKIWGAVPFPLLELHEGNPTLFFDEISFNTMNFFEFVSDQYVSGNLSYHLDGFLFNRIPLFRKLKWREVLSGKFVVGSLKESNKYILNLPDNMFSLNKPFYEVGAGIENIFRFIRLDAVWRLSYLDHPNIKKVAVKGSVHFNF
jgi:hypothetical protein